MSNNSTKTSLLFDPGSIPDDFTGIVMYKSGRKDWYLNGLHHRENGPVIIYFNNVREWQINGKLHREDGPAVEYPNGKKEWFVNGMRHREDGPAVEYPGGHKEYWLNGTKVGKSAFELYYMLKYKKLFEL